MGIWAAMRRIFGGSGSEPARAEAVPPASALDAASAQAAVPVLRDFAERVREYEESQHALAEAMRGASNTLHALPDLARQQARVLETLLESSARARHREETLERGLLQLGEGADRQAQVLSLMQQQLDLNHETAMRVAESLGELSGSIAALATNAERHTRGIEALAESTRRRVGQSERLEAAMRTWLMLAGGMSMVALASVAWFAWSLAPAAAVAPPSHATPEAATPQQPENPLARPDPTPPTPKGVGDGVPDLKAEAEAAEATEKTGAAPAPEDAPSEEPPPKVLPPIEPRNPEPGRPEFAEPAQPASIPAKG